MTRTMSRTCFTAVALFLIAPIVHAAGGNGMTWSKLSHDNKLGIDQMACNQGAPDGCNPYIGETSCQNARPLLCIRVDGSQRPPYTATGGEFYDGWAAGHIATTPPIRGFVLTTSTAGDQICQSAFGASWRMAEFHDNRVGGFGFRAYGDIRTDQHVWVKIDDQPANCWNP